MDLILAQNSFEQLVPLCDKTLDLNLAFIKEVSLHVSPQHAGIFAKPQYVKNVVFWHSEGHTAVSLHSLPQEQQQAVIQVIQSVLTDIACVARLYPIGDWSYQYKSNCCFPSLDYVYIVDGLPVITGWGYAGENGFYDPLQEDLARIKIKFRSLLWSKFPWISALIALFAGILVSLGWHVSQSSEKACYATYPVIREVEDSFKTQNQNKELENKRDGLLQSLQNLKTQCKVPPIKPEALKNPPELKKSETIDLPKTSWDKKEVSMLDGCWNLTTPLTLRSQKTKKIVPVKTWQVCFNESGKGNQTIEMVNEMTCKGPLTAHFQGTKIILEQPGYCDGDFTLVKGSHICTRMNDREASCLYKDKEPNSQGRLGIFKR